MMRNLYLLITLTVLFKTFNAQTFNIDNIIFEKKTSFAQQTSLSPQGIAYSAPPQPFWTNTFDSVPEWNMVDLVYGGLQNWTITNNGPAGTYSQSMGPIASTSANNGYAMYDSDALNSSYSPQEAYIQYYSTVDCSNYPYVNIEFDSYYRKFRDSVFVEVSIDGITWDRYEVHQGQVVNATSANPERISINISSTAGSQDSVYFRFKYEGQWDYAWMIDDVAFVETPNNFATINNAVIGGWWVGYQVSGGIGCDYTFNPQPQVSSNPYKFEAVLKNAGVANQNMTLHTEVFDQVMNSVFTSTSNSILLTASQQDTFTVNSVFSPQNLGLYEIRMWGVGDSANTDTITKQTVITSYTYGKDLNDYSGSYILANASRQNHITSYYDIYANSDLYSVDIYVAGWSVPVAKIYGILYENDPATTEPIYLSQTDDYTITNDDLENWVTLSFNNPVPLFAGTGYEIGAAGYQHPIDSSGVGVSGQALGTENSSFDEIGSSPNSCGVPTWYYITSNPMIRMNFDPSTSAGGGSTSTKNILTQDEVVISMDASNNKLNLFNINGYNKITVQDLLGKVIFSSSIDQNSHYRIETDHFSNGTYIVSLTSQQNIFSKKINLQ